MYLDTWWKQLLVYTVASYCTVKLLKLAFRRTRRKPYYSVTEYHNDVLYVFEFPRKWTRQLLNLSPFAVKLETWLRMKGVQYQVVETNQFSKATRQIPYVRYNGEEFADTLLILDQLPSVLDIPKDDITAEQEGVTRAFIRLVDEGLAITHLMFRYTYLADSFFGVFLRSKETPLGNKMFKFFFKLMFIIRGKFVGLGRHKQSVVGDIGKDDIRAISKYLGDKKFMFGDQIDCAMFGQLSHIVYLDLDFPHKVVLDGECSNIRPYLDRIKEALWKDWDTIVNPEPFA